MWHFEICISLEKNAKIGPKPRPFFVFADFGPFFSDFFIFSEKLFRNVIVHHGIIKETFKHAKNKKCIYQRLSVAPTLLKWALIVKKPHIYHFFPDFSIFIEWIFRYLIVRNTCCKTSVFI